MTDEIKRVLPVQCETVDAATGKSIKTEMVGFQIMPARAGTCAVCGVKHEPYMPHNAQSMFYQYRFFGQHGRWPTWSDAIAHTTPEMQTAWKAELTVAQHWTFPPDGAAPIAEPYQVQT